MAITESLPSLNGRLFQVKSPYEKKPPLVCFESGHIGSINILVFIGGLTNILLGVPYIFELSEVLGQDKWALVHANLSSAGFGFAHGSLRQDADELNAIVKHLRQIRSDCNIYMMGHSTGCQDVMQFLSRKEDAEKISGAIMQAPVSDREYFQTLPRSEKYITIAEEFIDAGRDQEAMPREAFDWGSPITAYRGDDDFFSSDIPDDELQQTFGRLKVPVLAIVSASDEYMPSSIDKNQLIRRWSNMAKSKLHVVLTPDGVNHDISKGNWSSELIKCVQEFLRKTSVQ